MAKIVNWAGIPQKFSEIGPNEFARVVSAHDRIEEAVADGRFFIGTTVRIDGGTTTSIRGAVANPAASGVRLYVVQLSALIEPTGVTYGRLDLNPTLNVPTTAALVTNASVGHANAASGAFTADAGAETTGGTDIGRLGLIGPDSNEIALPPLVLDPGETVVLNIGLGSLASATGSLGAQWFEEAV